MTIIDTIRGVRRSTLWDAVRGSRGLAFAIVALIHLTALSIMVQTELDWFGTTLFLLSWGFLNGLFLLILRRPGMAGALSLAIVSILVVLSIFKSRAIWTTINFFDFLIIDPDTVAFMFGIFPQLGYVLLAGAAIVIPLLVWTWRIDVFRVPRRVGASLVLVSVACQVGLSIMRPEQPEESFQGSNHISNFARSGVLVISEMLAGGLMEYEAKALGLGQLPLADEEPCQPKGKAPNIIMVLDEASFDITAAPGIKVPPDYGAHFRSFDDKARKLVVEGSGGPTWYTEYNVLTGLAARSYRGLKFYVTRIAGDRVERGLPRALRRCGYQTISLYPAYGAFLGARRFQHTTGVEHFIDLQDMRGAQFVEPDRFYYDQALRVLQKQDGKPKFVFVYTMANHFPWHERYLPADTPEWRDLGNSFDVDEYIRRQTMSARDYRDFVTRLKRDLPDEPFLIVRFGDHQPSLSRTIVDPSADDAEIGRRFDAYDLRYFTTYYSIDTINFTPVDLSSALDRLEAPYLPVVIQEAAGLPLDSSFAEQKKILERCQGVFYLCAGGSEARRFNRLLIDAGLIKGMVSAKP